MYQIYRLFRETATEFQKHNISQMAASLAYFGLFATAPIIFITITILKFFLSDLQINYALINEVQTAAGPQVANTVETILLNTTRTTEDHSYFEIFSFILLLITATTLFIQLQIIFHTLWDIKQKKASAFIKSVRTRILALLGIIASGVALYIFSVLGIAINVLGSYIESITGYNSIVLQNVNVVVSFFFMIGILINIYKYFPEADISWKDALVGAIVTASLLTIGRYILIFYFGQNIIGSFYGTAGSLMVFLAWIYFSSLIFLFGIIFTRVHAEMIGDGIRPD